jgi:tetratricopeptide (TPR) repeat protein
VEFLAVAALILGFLIYEVTKLRRARRSATRAPDRNGGHDELRQSNRRLADQLIRQIRESIAIAEDSQDPGTKADRIKFARSRWEQLKKLSEKHPYIELDGAESFESALGLMEFRALQAGFALAAEGNERGKWLEKQGRIDEAIAQYESLAALRVETPYTYRRLAILYRKAKRPDDETRAIRMALDNISADNYGHAAWFMDRMEQMRSGPRKRH